jgi:hypothetical protein
MSSPHPLEDPGKVSGRAEGADADVEGADAGGLAVVAPVADAVADVVVSCVAGGPQLDTRKGRTLASRRIEGVSHMSSRLPTSR